MQAILYSRNISIINIQEYKGVPLLSYTKNRAIIEQYGEKIIEIIDDVSNVKHDAEQPLYARQYEDGRIIVKNIISQFSQTVATYHKSAVTSYLICNGNIYIYMKNHRSIRAIMNNGSNRLYNYHLVYSGMRNIVGMRRFKDLRTYFNIDLRTGEDSVVVKSYKKLNIHYCNNKYLVYSEEIDTDHQQYPGYNRDYVIMNILEKKIESIEKSCILTYTQRGISLIRHIPSLRYTYYDLEDYKKSIYVKYADIGLEHWGIAGKHKITYLIGYMKKINDNYYAQIYDNYQIKDILDTGIFDSTNKDHNSNNDAFMSNILVKLGKCCICGELIQRGILCMPNKMIDRSLSKIHNLHCIYLYKSIVRVYIEKYINMRYIGCDDLIDYIYSILFGRFPENDRLNGMNRIAAY
jgi:hypothetical protein